MQKQFVTSTYCGREHHLLQLTSMYLFCFNGKSLQQKSTESVGPFGVVTRLKWLLLLSVNGIQLYLLSVSGKLHQ